MKVCFLVIISDDIRIIKWIVSSDTRNRIIHNSFNTRTFISMFPKRKAILIIFAYTGVFYSRFSVSQCVHKSGLSLRKGRLNFNTDHIVWGTVLMGHDYGRIFDVSLSSCVKECALRTRCRSINYNSQLHLCTLNLEDDGQFLDGSSEDMFVDIVNINKTALNNCTMCEINYKCDLARKTCRVSDCGDPPTIAHSKVQGYNLIGDHMTYICSLGYKPEGYRYTICLENGTWTPTTFSCSLHDCGPPPFVHAAVIGNGGTTYNSIRSYTCNATFTKIGPLEIRCGENGHWSTPEGSCSLTCPEPSSSAKVEALYSQTIYAPIDSGPEFNVIGTKRRYMCPGCLRPDGQHEITCKDDRSWSSASFSCVLGPCAVDTDCSAVFASVCSNGVCQCKQGYTYTNCKCMVASAGVP